MLRRSEINRAIREAAQVFHEANWALPPNPRWDVTDFGLGRFAEFGLVLVNLAEQPEYCEKIMHARKGQKTPAHCHARKKEDIIVRRGAIQIRIWNGTPSAEKNTAAAIQRNGEIAVVPSGTILDMAAGERVTLPPGIFHEFWSTTHGCIIGEVSTANDDQTDNFFADSEIGRFPEIEEDETPLVKLVRE